MQVRFFFIHKFSLFTFFHALFFFFFSFIFIDCADSQSTTPMMSQFYRLSGMLLARPTRSRASLEHSLPWIIRTVPREKVIRNFRRINLSMRMLDLLARPHVQFFGWSFPLVDRLRDRTAKVLARLRACAGSPELLLFVFAITALFLYGFKIIVIIIIIIIKILKPASLTSK